MSGEDDHLTSEEECPDCTGFDRCDFHEGVRRGRQEIKNGDRVPLDDCEDSTKEKLERYHNRDSADDVRKVCSEDTAADAPDSEGQNRGWGGGYDEVSAAASEPGSPTPRVSGETYLEPATSDRLNENGLTDLEAVRWECPGCGAVRRRKKEVTMHLGQKRRHSTFKHDESMRAEPLVGLGDVREKVEAVGHGDHRSGIWYGRCHNCMDVNASTRSWFECKACGQENRHPAHPSDRDKTAVDVKGAVSREKLLEEFTQKGDS